MVDFCAEFFNATPADVESGLRDPKYKNEFDKAIAGKIRNNVLF
jgi:hypothetical protein